MSKKFKINIQTIFDKGVERYIGHLKRGIERAKTFGAAMRKGMHSAPVRMLRNALAGLVAGLAAGVLQAAKFNVEMARAWTMSSRSVGWFNKMRKGVRLLSGDLGLAADQLSGGLYQALSAGVDEDTVLDFLHTAAKIAVADGSDVSVAVDGMTTILNAFKIEASKSGEVADQLFNVVANGKTSFGQLAPVLATAAPLAAATGVSFKEMLAAVATLTKQGTPTAQAMTQIRSAITGTTKVLGDGWAKTMSLQEAFKLVDERAGGSQKTLLKLVGSIEAVNGVMGLTGLNAQMAAADLESTADAAGSVDRAFQKVDQFRHWPKVWQSIAGLVTRTAQEADSRLGPAVMKIVEDLARVQGDDDLWRGLGDTLDEAMVKVTGIVEYINSEGKEGVEDVMEDLGLILLGHAKNGAQEAIALLAKWVPVLGSSFATSAISVLTKIGQDNPSESRKWELQARASAEVNGLLHPVKRNKRFKALYAAEKEKNARERLRRSGETLRGSVGSGAGDLDIAKGVAGLTKKVTTGIDKKNSRPVGLSAEDQKIADEYIAQMKAQALADMVAGREFALDQARGLYGRQRRQEGAAREDLAVAKQWGRDVPEATAKLEAERQQTAEVAELIRAVQGGNDGLIQAMLEALQRVTAKQEELASQIRNGRS